MSADGKSPPLSLSIETIVRGLIVDGSRVLMCRNIEHGYLYLPGGHVDPGEDAASALAREFMEEAGLGVEVGDCMLVSEVLFRGSDAPHHEINLVFHVTPLGTTPPLPDIESLEPHISFEWVERASVVDLDVRPASLRAWLASCTEPDLIWISDTESA